MTKPVLSESVPSNIIGWDIGGAHLKAARLDYQGHVIHISLQACPLWQGLEYLTQAAKSVLNELSVDDEGHCCHVLTMTGELVDLFTSRQQGVREILQTMKRVINVPDILVYAGKQGFLPINVLTNQYCLDIASANWLASASFVATQVNSGLFIDIGSTTTDILLIKDGYVKALGFTDYQRLLSAELVYTGIVRTPVMSVTHEARFYNRMTGLMAENFATMADVYRLTGELNEAHDVTTTADGAPKTHEASARRLSRMVGYDYSSADKTLWIDFAQQLKKCQQDRIVAACNRQLARTNQFGCDYFIGAGIGRFLIKQIADEMGKSYLDFTDLIHQSVLESPINSADCAPAVAVARLATIQQSF